MKLAVMIRGHVRDSFQDDQLDKFLLLLGKEFDVSIHIHTWNISEARKGSSWRHLEFQNLFLVNRYIYTSYFNASNQKKIKHLYIDDDSKINLNGNLEGLICKTQCPLIGWKRMFWGQNMIIKKIHDSGKRYDAVLSIRPDLFSRFDVSTSDIIKMISEFKNKKISFLNDRISNHCIEVDNCFVGKVDFVYELIKSMHEDLDSLVDRYPDIFYQEALVYHRSFELLNEKN
jgi:hypothetical protein